MEEYLGYAERLRPHIADTSLVLNKALDEGKVVLLEGGQGTLLDVDHGTYPFVTSSNPTARRRLRRAPASARPGITRVIGILKAYTTRVGSGPFPTELVDEMGEWLRTDRRRVRRDHRPQPALRLVRRGHRPLRDPGQRRHRLLPHQAGRAVRPGADPGLRGLRGRRRRGTTRSR